MIDTVLKRTYLGAQLEKNMTAQTAIRPLEAAELAGNMPAHDLSMLGLFFQADFIVKSVMLMLILASIWCWAIIFNKYTRFKILKRNTAKFEESFWSGDMLEHLYERVKQSADHPIAMVFVAGMTEWMTHDMQRVGGQSLRIGLKERIQQAMSVARNRSIEKLEQGLSFLATVGSTAPFVGLFGTVWGIMNSFQSIAASKNTSLAVVAPGIAEALFATAIGLFAAIPAVIFYNKFSNDLNRFASKVDDFAQEFSAILSRELDAQEMKKGL
jgi:biopolymer transport protein TolQ